MQIRAAVSTNEVTSQKKTRKFYIIVRDATRILLRGGGLENGKFL